MRRIDLVTKHFQRKHLLTTSNEIYRKQLTDLFQWMIQADQVNHDITSKNLKLSGSARASIQAKQNGIIAGIEEVIYLLRQKNLIFNAKVSDGTLVYPGDIIAQINGNSVNLLGFERSILNILGRMSGIATTTQQIISWMKGYELPLLSATRKTPWMFLDKKAVAVGGGLTHRLNLEDWPLIKDTYLITLKKELQTESVEDVIIEAVKRMVHSSVGFFEIEVENTDQAFAAFTAFKNESVKPDIELYPAKQKTRAIMAILLDNFQPKDALKFVSEMQKTPLYDFVLIEISGGVTEKNISSWTKIPVDVISLGVLTHSSPVFDLSMSIS